MTAPKPRPSPHPRSGFDPRVWPAPAENESAPVARARPSDPPAAAGLGLPEIRLREGDVFVDRFAVEGVAGEGRTGVVYKAKDVETRAEVALRIHDGPTTDEERDRFFADVRGVSRYYDPRLIRLLRAGQYEGRLFLAMDWVSGETLQARLDRQPLTLRDAVTVIRGIAEGLRALHGAVQGNLRPRNVLLRNRNVDWVKLSDTAVWRGGAPPAPTVADAHFVAPEVLRTGVPTVRGDLYALGVIAFRVLTGCLPFEAEDLAGLARARSAAAPALLALRPGAPPELGRLVDALLQSDPAGRPQGGIAAAALFATPLDLGWGADDPPFEMARDPEGRRVPVRAARPPLDPFGDAHFQDFVARELAARSPDPLANARLSLVAHGAAGPGRDSPGCALCGFAGRPGRTLVEVRDGGFFPLEDFEIKDARPPAVCVACVRERFVAIDAAVQRTLAEHQGDATRPLGTIGPTRGEVRSGLRALYDAAVPRVGDGRCAVCRAAGRVVLGARMEVCPACLSAAAAAHDKWLSEAPVRRAARTRGEFNAIYRLAEDRAGRKRGVSPAPKEGVDDLPKTRMWANGSSCAFSLDRLRAERAPTQAQIDALADQFADTLLVCVHTAIEGDPEVGLPHAIAETGYLARFTSEFRAAYRPSPAKDERLRVAVAAMAEGVRRGMQVYQKDDDNCYTHNVTGYFEDFKDMPVR